MNSDNSSSLSSLHILCAFPPLVCNQVTYSLVGPRFEMKFEATTDAATPLAMTNHTYWNLSGELKAKITDHTLLVKADKCLVLGEHMVSYRVWLLLLVEVVKLLLQHGADVNAKTE